MNTSDHGDLKRLKDHFPQESELTLQVLKGHLLVEEAVREALDIALANPKALKGESGTTLNCHQAICLLEANLPPNVGTPWLWTACKMLNRIRNDLAHKLDQGGLKGKVQNLVSFCLNGDPNILKDGRSSGMPKGKEQEFLLVVIALCAAISALKSLLHKRSKLT
jgi:hypothetical protein